MEKVIRKKGTGNTSLPVPFLATLFVTLILSSRLFAQEPVISRVALSQKAIDLSKDEKAVVKFQLSEEAQVDLKIYDEVNTLVRELKGEAVLEKGEHQITWDGRDQKSDQLVSGVYYYVLEAKKGTVPVSQETVPFFSYDPRGQTGGEEVLVEKLSWDVPNAMIHYILPKASYVRIRIGLKEGVFLGSLQDWTPLEAGQKEFPWNGRDLSGYFDLSNHPEAQINIAAFALADNTVIVKSNTLSSPLMGEDKGGGDTTTPHPSLSPQRGEGVYLHARHPRSLCRELHFEVEFLNAPTDPETHIPLLVEKTPVRITLDPKDRDYLVANRFEIMFFVDSVFLFEQGDAASPLTYYLSATQLGEGDHLLTINVVDYEDHIGVQTVKVRVPPVRKDVANAPI